MGTVTVVFFSLSRKMPEEESMLDHKLFLPDPFQLIFLVILLLDVITCEFYTASLN
jgi:hypothetical protein